MAHEEKGKDFTSKWISSPGKRMPGRPSKGTKRKKINPDWIEEKYNVRVKGSHGGGGGI